MMQALRSNTKPIFLIIIFAFVVGFVFLQGQQMLGGFGRDPNVIAVVNGSPITYQQWLQQYSAAQSQIGGAGNMSSRMRVQLKQSTYEDLVRSTLLRQAAEARGLGTDLEEVLEVLRRQPPAEVLQSPIFMTDGQFDMSKYYQALGSQEFLSQMSAYYIQQLPLQKLNDQIASAAKTSNAEALQVAAARTQMATVSYIRISPSLFGPDPASFSQEEVEAYYREHTSDYTPEETAVVTYLYLPRQPSPLDSLETSEVLQSIYYELQAGEPFDELLDIHSEGSTNMRGGPDGAFIGNTSPSMTPELRAALDTLSVGAFTAPFSDTYGYHVVALDSTRTEEDGSTSYRIKDLLMRVSVSSTTEREAEAYMSGVYEDARKQKGNLAAVADTSKIVRVFTTPPIDLSRSRPFIDANIPAFAELLEFCKEASPGELGSLLEGPGGYFLWKLDERGPGRARELSEVESLVRADMVNRRGKDAAERLAESIAQRAKAGETLEAIAEGDTLLRVDTSRPFSRAGSISGIGKEPEIMGAAFAISIGSVAGPFEASNGLFYVIRLDERTDRTTAGADSTGITPEAVAGNVHEVQGMKQDRVLISYMDELRKNADIRDMRPIKTGTL